MGWAVAAPLIGAALGSGTSIYTQKKQADAQKKAYKEQQANRYAFSEEDRAMARQFLMRSLFSGPFGMMQGGQQGAPGGMPQGRGGGLDGAQARNAQFQQFMKMVKDRYERPTVEYQGYLQSVQERRDARGGVPQPPPQGAGSPSAQRRNPNAVAGYGGGRTY